MSRAQFTDYCPLCHHAAGILNVGREHYAVCHDCRAYQHIGSKDVARNNFPTSAIGRNSAVVPAW